MLVPLSWLLEYAPLREPIDGGEVARRLTAVGLEIEGIEQVGHDVSSVVIARVVEIEELSGFKKPVRYCRVTTGGPDAERQVICGAVNFAVGDLVPLALPGASLPGGFEIGVSKRYGRVSDGMICSAAELALGDDHSGILVLPPHAPLGAAFVAYAGLRVALRCRDPFGKRLAAGLTTLICGQALINLSVVLGMVPTKGIPLPFVSYGGSSLIVMLLGTGVLLNISQQASPAGGISSRPAK